MTIRLFHIDENCISFGARVVSTWVHDEKTVLVLDRSAFYPESGGQQADFGQIDGVSVVDVQKDEHSGAESIAHFLADASKTFSVGDEVWGEVDKRRRREHRQMHTGQHLLSQAALKELGAATLSSRLGETECTLDLDLPDISPEQILRLQKIVHDVVDEDRLIRAYFPNAATLEKLDLRRSPKVAQNIRVIEIEGYDVTPCGGTHCSRTGEVGLLHIFKVERVRQKVRLCFLVGIRARTQLLQDHKHLQSLVAPLNARGAGLLDGVLRLQQELSAAELRIQKLEKENAKAEAANFKSEKGHVVQWVSNKSPALLSVMAEFLLQRDDVQWVCLAVAQDEKSFVLCMSAKSAELNCQKLFQQLTTLYGGRGGGKPERSQGKIATLFTDDSAFKNAVHAANAALSGE